MATKPLSTTTKLENLQQLKKDRIAKIEAELLKQQTFVSSLQLSNNRRQIVNWFLKVCKES